MILEKFTMKSTQRLPDTFKIRENSFFTVLSAITITEMRFSCFMRCIYTHREVPPEM